MGGDEPVAQRLVKGDAFRRVTVVGGAGFIGSHLVARLLASDAVERVVVFDNFTSGRRWHLAASAGDPRLEIVEGEATSLDHLVASMHGATAVVHLASNPDIARAMTEPTIDFDQGTLLTHCVVESARRSEVPLVVYASGSGVYGDLGEREVDEDHGPLTPISTYGASKLAGEALLCSYAHMFAIRTRALRFANVVGPRQTHGVGFDFLRKLLADPTHLEVLGDGTQSKSYIHVDDVVAAILLVGSVGDAGYDVFNVATADHLTVTEIAEMAVACLGLPPDRVALVYTGGDRGWKGDVPVVRLSTARIRALGWRPARSSREAMQASLAAMRDELRSERPA